MKKYFPIIKALLIVVIYSSCIAVSPIDVSAQQPGVLAIDVWTNKGGQGEGVSGGSFQVGEPVILYAKASISCQGKLTWMGPSGTGLRQLTLQEGEIVNIPLSFPDASAIGLWQVKLEALYENQNKTDLTSLFITDKSTPQSPPSTPVAPAPAPAPTPTPPPAQSQPSTSPPQQSAAKIGPGNATELDALMALKITEGLLTTDPRLDVNSDGKITTEDVMLILLWSVGKNAG